MLESHCVSIQIRGIDTVWLCFFFFNQDGRCLGQNSSIEPQSVVYKNSITRKAGGRKEAEKEMLVRDILPTSELLST